MTVNAWHLYARPLWRITVLKTKVFLIEVCVRFDLAGEETSTKKGTDEQTMR